MRKFASIAVVVVGVLVVGGLLGWAGGRMLVKPQVPAQATIAQNNAAPNSASPNNVVQTPAPAPSDSYQTRTLLGLPAVNIPGDRNVAQKDAPPVLTDTLGNGNPPPVAAAQTTRAPAPADNGPSYGPSSSAGIVLIGPSDKPQPILPPMKHNPPPLNNATPKPLQPPPQLAMPQHRPAEPVHVAQAPVKQALAKPAPVKPTAVKSIAAKPAAEAKHKRVKQVAAKPPAVKAELRRHGAQPASAHVLAPSPTKAQAVAAGPWAVQLGVFREGLNAQDLLARLARKGETAHVVQRHGMNIVYIPGGSQAAALAMAKKLKAEGFDTYVMKGF
ncbi:MAG TPA: SPOR domain-containing protein [Stellaceae bacterium]|nr:SPOR domain-containing protein [Stellaceae bacterium]